MTAPPPSDVLDAFGVTGAPSPMAGGQRTVWRSGDVVFKRLDSSREAVAWQSDVLRHVRSDAGVRVSPPIPTVSGSWVVDEWTAWQFVSGRPAAPNWLAIIAAGRSLHAALRGRGRPNFVDHRDDLWARADRAVWDLDAQAPHPSLAAAFDARRPVDLADQLVHGDLAGNVLIEDNSAPAVIDFSPYWHPPAWADAVVVADAMLLGESDPSLVDTVGGNEPTASSQFAQLLLRAVLFRVVTGSLAGQGPAPDPHLTRAVARVAALASGRD